MLDERAEGVSHCILVRERLRQQVRGRADLEGHVDVAECAHQHRVSDGEDAVPDPVGLQRLDNLRDLCQTELAAFLADMNRHTETTVACELDMLANLGVVVATAARARAGDVDADDPARPVPERFLDDDHVLLRAECPVHHQDQTGAHLRVLERRDVEATDRGENDVVEITLAAAVSLHRVEAQLERRDALRTIRAADRRMHAALDGER